MHETRHKVLLAEQKSKELFTAVEKHGLLQPGKTEKQLIEEVVRLADDVFGIEQFWHKKIIRTGINTMCPFSEDPEDRVIEPNDILYLDFGPVYQGHEADLGRTYVLGKDPVKLKMKADVETAWYEAKKWYDQQTVLSGAELYSYLTDLAEKYGYEYGGEIGGHLVGPYPHEQPDDPKDLCFDIHPDNHSSILSLDKNGHKRHWILEIKFVDRKNNIGGFFEQLVDQGS